jgi:hypothetical protein
MDIDFRGRGKLHVRRGGRQVPSGPSGGPPGNALAKALGSEGLELSVPRSVGLRPNVYAARPANEG